MGSVLAFLVILILVTKAMSWCVLHFESPSQTSHSSLQAGFNPDNSHANNVDDARIRAVISIAISQYRNKQGAGK